MGMSTRSKTGSARLAPAPTIKKTPTPTPARSPKAKKPARVPVTTKLPSTPPAAKFPDNLTLFNDDGLHVSTADLATDARPAFVLFTYPRANTPGCTAQACALRDALPELARLGYGVYGLSYDKPKSQAGWRAKHSLGYSLLCDTLDVGLIKMLGAHKPPKGIKRSVFIVRRGDDGKLGVAWSRVGVSPKETVPLVIDYVQNNPSDNAQQAGGSKEKVAGDDDDDAKKEEAAGDKTEEKASEKGSDPKVENHEKNKNKSPVEESKGDDKGDDHKEEDPSPSEKKDVPMESANGAS